MQWQVAVQPIATLESPVRPPQAEEEYNEEMPPLSTGITGRGGQNGSLGSRA